MIRITESMRSKNTVKSALAYAKAGWRIHPLKSNSKQPLLQNWPKKATSDAQTIKKWFKQYPDANLGGIPPRNVFVLDADGDDGKKSFKSLGIKTITAKALTPHGNHRYFEGKISKSKIRLLKGLDLIGDDGSRYLVLPPSHLKDRNYKWRPKAIVRPLEAKSISKLNDLLRDESNGADISEGIHKGSRNNELFRIGCALSRRGVSEGAKRQVLLNLNKRECENPIPKKEVLAILKSSSCYGSSFEEMFSDMADVKEADVDWFWYPYMARGCLTIIEGAPGQGKSYLTMYLAALTSSGGKFPFSNEKIESGRVLILNAEDDPACILRPRLAKCGAVFSKNNIRFQTKFVPIDSKGIEILETEISAYRPDLVIIDPLLTYMLGDMHRYNEATNFMTEIDALARQYRCCIIGVRHLTKANNDDASKRGIGSVGFSARARSVLQIGKAPDNEDEKAIGHVKTNWGKYGKTLVFSLKGGGRDDVPDFAWEREADYSADDINKPKEPGRPSEQDPIRYFLRSKLQSGPAKVATLLTMAQDDGLNTSKRTMLRVLGKVAILEGKGPKAMWALKK